MYSRTYQTRKNKQNQISAPTSNPFVQRSFGEDTPKQSQPTKSPEELDAAYQEAKQRQLNRPQIPVFPPGKEPPNPPQPSIVAQKIQAQIIQRNQERELHRQLFNPGVQNNSPIPIQAKMSIGAVGDKYEQEADQVASQVVNQINSPTSGVNPGQSVQRQEVEEELQAKPEITSLQRQEEEEEIQTKSNLPSQEAIGGGEASEDLTSAINSARGGGQPLDAELQRSMGQAMGADFSGVKVHTDSRADQLNQSIQAKAFTTGQDVFFRQGAYEPGSRGGQELIAHELTHVVQQGGAKGSVNCKIQRLLDKDQPIVSTDISAVANPHGNVYILNGFNNDGVVVKFEVAGTEGLSKYKARYSLGEELGGGMLDGAIAKNQLTAHDIQQLQNMAINANDDSGALVNVLNQGIANAAIGIKMDKLALGKDLFEMGRTNATGQHDQALQKMLDAQKCFRYGQMAYYDVLVRNYDRFNHDGTIMNNLDFDANYSTAVPLDNIYYAEGLVTRNWQAQLSEMKGVTPSGRINFAQTAVNTIVQASGQQFTAMKIASAITMFTKGMQEAQTRAEPFIKRYEAQIKFGGGRGRANTNQDETDTKLVLVQRYYASLI